MDAPSNIGHVVSDLSDLELAVLLSLVCQEHCLVETPAASVDDVSSELSLICERAFGLSYAVLDCSSRTSLEDFSNGILAPEMSRGRRYGGNVESVTSSSQSRNQSRFPVDSAYLDERKVVNVIIAKNFDHVDDSVQIQALEIDHLLFCHFHQDNAGYPNLEDDEGWISEDRQSSSSVVKKRHRVDQSRFHDHPITENIISSLRLSSKTVSVSAEVNRYLQNIVVFLRLNRAVVSGISARATRHFLLVAKVMATLHGIDYLTPSIVGLAAKKVYRHRIIVARADDDRSLQYGSQAESVEMLLRGVDADQIIETIPTIEPPTRYPRHITGALRTRYDHLHRLHYQLQDLWHFQLKNHRDPWSIQAAHDFWRRHGPPRTLDSDGGRKFGWNPDGNWILEGIADTENEMADLELNAKKRMRVIGAVMGNSRARVSAAAAAAKSRGLSSAGGNGGGGVAIFDKLHMQSLSQGREMGFTSDARYQNTTRGLIQYTPAVDPPCLQPSNFPWGRDNDDDKNNYITTGGDAYDDKYNRPKLSGSPENPIIIDDDDDDDYHGNKKDEDDADDILHLRKFCEQAITNDGGNNDNEDLFFGSLQDSPSMMGLDRRHYYRCLGKSPEYVPEYIPGSILRDIHCGDETSTSGDAAVVGVTTLSISSSSSSSSPKTIQGKDPTPSSNSSSPSKKRVRSEEVEYLGEARCKKSPKRDADLNQDQVPIAPISI
ncbi:hypothetical protein PISL3812_01719 [Talaromyces islandicus]|uniref:magnesium chelatase n=1 Tax=Talaromyces islandicus TaxID=28573 RepID=A0A0U1LQ27_TALIS|nr:hypothetical protein PISL3812_01719 [Talaromyces islandicus]